MPLTRLAEEVFLDRFSIFVFYNMVEVFRIISYIVFNSIVSIIIIHMLDLPAQVPQINIHQMNPLQAQMALEQMKTSMYWWYMKVAIIVAIAQGICFIIMKSFMFPECDILNAQVICNMHPVDTKTEESDEEEELSDVPEKKKIDYMGPIQR